MAWNILLFQSFCIFDQLISARIRTSWHQLAVEVEVINFGVGLEYWGGLINNFTMRRLKQQIEPLCLQSPEQDLCEISMQIDQNQPVSNFMAPFVPPQKQLKFDGWVRVESKIDEKLISHRSHIIENLTRPIKHQDASLRYSPSRTCQKRSSLQQSHSPVRAIKEEISLARAQSQEMPRQFQVERQTYHSVYLNDSSINVRKGSGYTRETNRNDRQLMTKKQVGTVNYPILEMGSSNDPEKKYMFHIGRIRRMININSKGKRK